jgi:hypothetical protein
MSWTVDGAMARKSQTGKLEILGTSLLIRLGLISENHENTNIFMYLSLEGAQRDTC